MKTLDDFADPLGPSAQLQTDRLMQQLRKAAVADSATTYRVSEDGPEQTAAEILAEIEADDAFINALREALDQRDLPKDQ